MCQVLTHCGFSGVSPDGNCAYVHWGSFTSNSRSVRRAIWFTWFSEPHECIQHMAVPGGHPSNYEPGATLLNFSDRANTDELTPYSVCYLYSCVGIYICAKVNINYYFKIAAWYFIQNVNPFHSFFFTPSILLCWILCESRRSVDNRRWLINRCHAVTQTGRPWANVGTLVV